MVDNQLITCVKIYYLLAGSQLFLLTKEAVVQNLIDLAVHFVVEIGWLPDEVTLSREGQLSG